MYRKITLILYLLLMGIAHNILAQSPTDSINIVTDTIINNVKYSGNLIVEDTSTVKTHSPKRAGIYSACLPGLGQGYNKKYWKIPVVWIGFGATGYMIYSNAVPMRQVRDAYMWVDQGAQGTPPNDIAAQYGNSLSKLESVYNEYRHQVELFTMISLVWYFVNIIDAVVDAHLKDFDISDNVSMSIQPTTPLTFPNQQHYYSGLSVSLNF